jgi:DNA polymerase III delta subunit
VVVVSGGVDFLRHRAVRQVVQSARARGRRLVTVAAGDEAGLRELFSGGFLFSDATVAVVESAQQRKRASRKKKEADAEGAGGWSEEALEMVLEHAKDDSGDLAIVVHHDGEAGPNTFAGQVAAALPKNLHKVFPAPKPWEEKDVAVKFLVGELRKLGKTVDEALAEQVVRKVGADLGLLSFEAVKFSTALDVDKRTEVTAPDVASLVASFGGEDWEVLKSALAARNTKLLVRTWNEIRNGPGGDAVQKAIAILSSTVVKWTHAAALHEMGVGPEEAAARAGMHPYPYKSTVLPAAVRWGRVPLENLLRSITQIGVRKGHINPWVALESVLVTACSEGR